MNKNSSFDIRIPEIIGESPVSPPEYLRILREEIDPTGRDSDREVKERKRTKRSGPDVHKTI